MCLDCPALTVELCHASASCQYSHTGLDATDALLALLLEPDVEPGLQSISWHLLLSSTMLPKLTDADLSEVRHSDADPAFLQSLLSPLESKSTGG